MYPPPSEPSHSSHLGKMGSELRSEPSQSRHKGVTPAVTNWLSQSRNVRTHENSGAITGDGPRDGSAAPRLSEWSASWGADCVWDFARFWRIKDAEGEASVDSRPATGLKPDAGANQSAPNQTGVLDQQKGPRCPSRAEPRGIKAKQRNWAPGHPVQLEKLYRTNTPIASELPNSQKSLVSI